MFMLSRLFAFFLFFLTPLTLFANDLNYNQVSLQTSASSDVANDVLVAMLVVQEIGKQPAALAARVNAKMESVLDKVNKYDNIDSHTTSYSSQPQYNGGKISAWVVSQQIKLSSQNFEQLGKLIGDLNELSRVQSMTFKVSDPRIEETKAQLTKTAIAKFQAKAGMITEQFAKKSYQLVHVSIDGNFARPQPMRMERMMSDAAMAAPPATSAGTNKITVTINGTIELEEE